MIPISERLQIEQSEAKSWYKDDQDYPDTHAPQKAYDGDYKTTYHVKDADAEGNYLKLYLSQKYKIGTVTLTNEKDGCCEQRIIGTVVMVYSISDETQVQTKVGTCGERITGTLSLQFTVGGNKDVLYSYYFINDNKFLRQNHF